MSGIIFLPMGGGRPSGPPRCVHCGKAYPMGKWFLNRHPWLIFVIMFGGVWIFSTTTMWILERGYRTPIKVSLLEYFASQWPWLIDVLRSLW